MNRVTNEVVPVVSYLYDIVEHIQDAKLPTLQKKCDELIDLPNSEVSVKVKIKIIQSVYDAILKIPHAPVLVPKTFGLLFKKLSGVEGITDNKRNKCFKKAIALFETVIERSQKDYDSYQCLGDIYTQLAEKNKKKYSQLASEYTAKASELEKQTTYGDCIISKLNSFSHLSLSDGYVEKLITIDGFDRHLSELEEALKGLKSSTGEQLIVIISDEKAFIRDLFSNDKKLTNELSDFKRKLKESPMCKEFYISTKKTTLLAIEDITTIKEKISLLEHCGEIQELQKSLTNVKKLLSLFVTFIGTEELNAIEKDEMNPEFSIIKNICYYTEAKIELECIIKEKNGAKSSPYVTKNSIYEAWENFFQFTEKNYLCLNKERKEKLRIKLIEAKIDFESIKTAPKQESDRVIATYISILVQGHPFIVDVSEQNENVYNIRFYSAELNNPLRQYRKDNKMLDSIMSSCIKQGDSTHEGPMLSSRVSPSNVIKKEADNLIAIAIKVHERIPIHTSLKDFLDRKENKINEKLYDLITYVSATYTGICLSDLKKHGLTNPDVLKIAYVVSKALQLNEFDGYPNASYLKRDSGTIMIKKNGSSTRSLVIDTKKKSFTILSELHGDLKKKDELGINDVYICGRDKTISAAVTFTPNHTHLSYVETILARPLQGHRFGHHLVKYFDIFEGKRGLASCHSYMEYVDTSGSTEQLNQLFIQDRAQLGDFDNFLSSHSLENPKTWEIIFTILEDVAHGLFFMHSNGLIHWDIKPENILVYLHDKQYSGKITDFDETWDAGSGEQPSWLLPLYGSFQYEAPEVNRTDAFNGVSLSAAEATARDMFALGCVCTIILELHKPTNNPLYNQISLDKKIGENEMNDLIESKARILSRTYREELEFISYYLLYPNPQKRWTCNDFLNYITELQKSKSQRKYSF